MLRFYTTEKLGPKQSVTPEGFLLVEDAPLARTGQQIYGPEETGIQPGPDGLVRIERPLGEVFRAETIASFAGKPVCNDHPEENGERVDVTPDNWSKFAVGTIQNPRRGTGAYDDCIVGDLLITERRAINDVRRGKRELSCGYDADYIDDGAGQGHQRNIIGNHVALVDSGRCGPRCAIGDRASFIDHRRTATMKKTWLQKIRDALKSGDKKAIDAAIADAEAAEGEGEGEGGQHFHSHVHIGKEGEDAEHAEGGEDPIPGITKRLGNLEDALKPLITDYQSRTKGKTADETEEEKRKREEQEGKGADAEISHKFEMEAPPGTSDAARKASDSALLSDSFQDTIMLSEILVPGISLPVFDKADPPTKTIKSIDGLRRKALDLAYNQPKTRGYIEAVWGDKAFEASKLSYDAARSVFRGAAGMARAANNGAGARTAVSDAGGAGTMAGMGVKGQIRTLADLNKANREYYDSKKAG